MRSSLALVAVLLAGAGGSARPFTPEQHRIADALVSEFESSTPTPQYCYLAALGDGRGYTVGRAGFTSATGDLLEVVVRYTRAEPGNPLARFLPQLRALARTGSPSLRGLGGFPVAWRATCRDRRQRASQDAVVDREYLQPAVRTWRSLGLRTALSLAALYDAEIQHGPGPDPDGVPALVRRTLQRAGTVADAGERRWLTAFLAVRRADLLHPADRATRAEWRRSVDRVGVWSYLVRTGQWSLHPPVVVRTADYRLRLG